MKLETRKKGHCFFMKQVGLNFFICCSTKALMRSSWLLKDRCRFHKR